MAKPVLTHFDGDEFEEPVKYRFHYAVHNKETGDQKEHYEERSGDKVRGFYYLKEADGTARIVEYKADKLNGFQAVVHRIGKPKSDVEFIDN